MKEFFCHDHKMHGVMFQADSITDAVATTGGDGDATAASGSETDAVAADDGDAVVCFP
jgi:hypothetical protein